MTTDLFDDSHWTTADGQVLRISEMDTGHIINIRRFLLRRAPLIVRNVAESMEWLLSTVNGEQASFDLERELGWLRLAEPEECRDWMRGTPVFVALTEELDRRGGESPVNLLRTLVRNKTYKLRRALRPTP